MKITQFCSAWFLMVALTAAASGEIVTSRAVDKDRLITGEEPLPPMNPIPYHPDAATESPGITIGTTFYDYQSNASTGRRIAYSPDHRAQIVWMNGLNYPTPRYIYYNWVDSNGVVYETNGGCQISQATGGYPQFSLFQSIKGAIGYHQAGGTPPPYISLAYEADPVGECLWTYMNPPDTVPGAPRLYWPYFDIDRRNWIHFVSSEFLQTGRQRLFYTRSTNGGNSWTTLQFVDSIEVISAVVDASPVSDKVVIAYHKPGPVRTNIFNEIVYVQATDGVNWNFGNPTYVTNYRNDNDSMWAYCDLDLLIDYNDNINIAWTAFWCPDSAHLYWPSHLYHFNSGTGEINLVRPPWPESSSWYSNCDPGGWNMPICKMSMAVKETTGCLFMIWTQFDTSDCSEGGYANGEIYGSSSCNQGRSWLTPVNLTNTSSPGCFAGECESDNWASLAREVAPEFYVHIVYINDKDAGGIPQTEGSATENPVKYLKTEIPTSIDENTPAPINFVLDQNYPNPFNSKTVISFEIKKRTTAKIEIFDVTGGLVAVLLNRLLDAGRHEVVFDADKLASGIYYYKLSAAGETQTKKMVLVK